MKQRAFSLAVLGALALGLCLAGPVFSAENQDPLKPSRDVEREVEEAAEAIRDYSVEQRDEALRQGREALEDVDSRIRIMREQIEGHWNEMEPEVRAQARETLDKLREQRGETARWLEELRTGSAGAWEEITQGFVQSYEELRRSFERAGEKYR